MSFLILENFTETLKRRMNFIKKNKNKKSRKFFRTSYVKSVTPEY